MPPSEKNLTWPTRSRSLPNPVRKPRITSYNVCYTKLLRISGTISGGNVALTSTGGSIINETQAETTGGNGYSRTLV